MRSASSFGVVSPTSERTNWGTDRTQIHGIGLRHHSGLSRLLNSDGRSRVQRCTGRGSTRHGSRATEVPGTVTAACLLFTELIYDSGSLDLLYRLAELAILVRFTVIQVKGKYLLDE